jgi:hypothetical protein
MKKAATTRKTTPASAFLIAVIAGQMTHALLASIDIKSAPIPIQILAQSPAETTTDLQVICLFRSSPVSTLHGSAVNPDGQLDWPGRISRTRLARPPQLAMLR